MEFLKVRDNLTSIAPIEKDDGEVVQRFFMENL
jgi:hypothetical protein